MGDNSGLDLRRARKTKLVTVLKYERQNVGVHDVRIAFVRYILIKKINYFLLYNKIIIQ